MASGPRGDVGLTSCCARGLRSDVRLEIPPVGGSYESGRSTFNSCQVRVYLTMEYSAARRRFKGATGQTNHFLITILVGLEGVAEGKVESTPSFSTTWAPLDPEASARRSREFALASTLVFVADCLDSYLKDLSDSFPIEVPASLFDVMDETGRVRRGGLAERVNSLGQHFGVDRTTTAMVECAIVSRNRAAHASRNIKLDPSTAGVLRTASARLLDEYQRLEVEPLVDKLRSSSPSGLTFKETASILRAVHNFVQQVDHAVLTATDLSVPLAASLREFLTESAAASKKRAADIWGRGPSIAHEKVRTIARNFGGFKDAENPDFFVDPLELVRISEMSAHEGLTTYGAAHTPESNNRTD